MDPNATLTQLIILAHHEDRDAEKMADLIIALDEWLSKGGFLPKRWNTGGMKG